MRPDFRVVASPSSPQPKRAAADSHPVSSKLIPCQPVPTAVALSQYFQIEPAGMSVSSTWEMIGGIGPMFTVTTALVLVRLGPVARTVSACGPAGALTQVKG